MRTVTAREANQAFSRLLTEAAAGEEIVITRHGKPVARLGPVHRDKNDPVRRLAVKRMMAGSRKGANLGGIKVRREDIYVR